MARRGGTAPRRPVPGGGIASLLLINGTWSKGSELMLDIFILFINKLYTYCGTRTHKPLGTEV